MDKKSKKPSKIINFNFSDSEDEFQFGIKERLSHRKKQSDNSIVSSEFQRRMSSLPSFTEDIGPPVMDSTHLIDSKEKDCQYSARLDFLKKRIGKTKKVDDSWDDKITASTSIKRTVHSTFPNDPQIENEHYITALEYRFNHQTLDTQNLCDGVLTDRGEEKEVSANCVLHDTSNHEASPQECYSYYVQDASAQTSFLHVDQTTSAPSSTSATSIPSSPTTKDHQNLPVISNNLTNQVISDSQLSHENGQKPSPANTGQPFSVYRNIPLFDDCYSTNGSPVGVLANDSESDTNPDTPNDQLKNDAVIPDSEEDIFDCQADNLQAPDISPHIFDERKDVSDEKCSGLAESPTPCCDGKLSDPSSLRKAAEKEDKHPTPDADIDSITSSLSALSCQQGVSSTRQSQRKISSSSDDDDNFEKFLERVKTNQKNERREEQKNESTLDEFIVNSDDSSEADSNGECSGDDEDELFYIKTNNILEKKKINRERRRVKKKESYTSTSSSDYDSDQSGSDLSDSLVESESEKSPVEKGNPKNREVKTKTSQLKAPPSYCFGDKERTTPPNKTNAHKSWSGKENQVTPSSETNWREKREMRDTTNTTGLNPCWSSDSDDFLDHGKASKSNFPFSLPITTPKSRPQTANSFQTPIQSKASPNVHPWTAPKPFRPSVANSEDDKTFFLKSLSSDYCGFKRHPEAQRYIKSFKSLRKELTAKLFKVFNETVFESQIPSTVLLEWSMRYTKTAGTFSYRGIYPNYTTKITLSTKICDSPERVRDTLVHELCHAAVKLINQVNESHGRVWKSWARKVNKAFPFMPVVARCHDYIIHSKYTYQCVNCKYRIGRHSKSLDTERKVCGHCKGEFQVFLTSDLNSDASSVATPRTPRTPNKFALFVKDCYSEVKKKNAHLKHGDIMRELSKEFAEKNKL